jgi:serine/threonine protein kinase/TPR repeat protein
MPTADRYQQYELLRREDGSFWELGRGAMGITYKAYDTNLRFPVALKVINSACLENDTARQRFLREARAAAALRHPNVASVFNLGTVQEKYFYVMEFIDGETLEARVKREGPLRPVEALNIALQVTRALAAAAKQQLVHRDLKPTNLMLIEEEGEVTVKVIDFGLAKITKETGEESAALTIGGFVGTPHFASPEQVEDGDIDIRSDIYSLGATLYFVLTGQSPFSGSVGQVMSQHLYKPLPLEPLKDQPRCVASLVQRMMEKNPSARPQTPQELQKEILTCLTEIRGMDTQEVSRSAEAISPSETIDLNVASTQPLAPGVTIAQVYYLIEEIGDSPLGRRFLADDLLHRRRVNLLVLSPDLLADTSALTSLRDTVNLVRKAPHPTLQEIYALETFPGCTLLAEEYVTGISLLDVLRVRSALTAPEIVRLLSLLAPLADHASSHGLQHIDFSLSGIRFINREGNREGFQSTLLRRPLTAWESAHPKVNAIDLSFLPASKEGTWSGMATQMQGAAPSASSGSCVRSLSLLAYELLGGPRAKLEATGRYTPVASLSQEGNAVLRSGLADEFESVGELVRQLESTARVPQPGTQPSDTAGRSTSEPSRQRSPTQIPAGPPPPRTTYEIPAGTRTERRPRAIAWLFALACLLVLLIGVSFYLLRPPAQPPPIRQMLEIPALSITTDPPGGAILLDGKPPQAPPNTFTHVPFGRHSLSAALDGYEPFEQQFEVRRDMAPNVRLRLKPIVEIPALTIQTEPAGASVLLDGKAPQAPPNTFTHVPFGAHELSAMLDGYEPIKQELQVRRGMTPEIRLQLKPIVELPTLTIQTEPPGASVLLDGKPPQAPSNTFTHVPFGTHELSARLDGYEPIKQEVQVHRGMPAEVRLQLKPIVEIPALTIQTEPAGASVLLDGKPPQAPPNIFTRVPFGMHELSATLDGYEPVKQELQVRKGMAPEVRLQLKPIVEIPALTIETEPAGASILLDGKQPQKPPNTFTHVPFGAHQLSVTLDGYEPIKQELEVRRGMVPEVRLQLRPIVEIPALAIQTEPEGGSVLLDGRQPQAPPNTFTHVPFGPHRLSATLDGYESIEQELQVRRGMAPEIRLQLKPIHEIPALTIQTEPAGASILLDGNAPQMPPNIFTHVPFGSHELTVALEGYESIRQNLPVAAGMNPEIRLQLKASPAPDSFEAYLRDAQGGDSTAMMKLGRLYFKKGTPADDVEGFNWLNRAYNAPNPNLEAGAYIGDCYLSGRGTKQDVQKAEETIIPLANQHVVPAMTLAGRIFQYKGELKREEAAQSADPQTRKRLEIEASQMDRAAVSWWQRAEKDDWNAAAHLGKCYEQGWGGLEKNPEQAEIRYKGGVSHGNPVSMLFYGLMIENRPGRHQEAELLISKAAAAGLPSAIKWCKDNNVDFSQKISNDDH